MPGNFQGTDLENKTQLMLFWVKTFNISSYAQLVALYPHYTGRLRRHGIYGLVHAQIRDARFSLEMA